MAGTFLAATSLAVRSYRLCGGREVFGRFRLSWPAYSCGRGRCCWGYTFHRSTSYPSAHPLRWWAYVHKRSDLWYCLSFSRFLCEPYPNCSRCGNGVFLHPNELCPNVGGKVRLCSPKNKCRHPKTYHDLGVLHDSANLWPQKGRLRVRRGVLLDLALRLRRHLSRSLRF